MVKSNFKASLKVKCTLCFSLLLASLGQWIEKRHVYLSIALLWVYTLFWASLPAFGFGSYGAEPYETSCTINW